MGAGVSFAIGETPLYENKHFVQSSGEGVRPCGPSSAAGQGVQRAGQAHHREADIAAGRAPVLLVVLVDSWLGDCRISLPLRPPRPLGRGELVSSVFSAPVVTFSSLGRPCWSVGGC